MMKRSHAVKWRLLWAGLALIYLPLESTQRDFNPKSFDRFIEKAMEITQQPGLAVAVVKGERVVFMKGYGLRSLETKRAVDTDTLFNIASLTKAFTAALVGELVHQGQLDWEEPVVRLYPRFRLSDPWVTGHLTLRDLLSHRIGLATFEGDLLWYATDYSPQELIERMARIPLSRQFRSQFGYQNNSYIVAGELIKEVTGHSWGRRLKERVFQPLGMASSLSHGGDLSDEANWAKPYVGQTPHPYHIRTDNPAASIFSSVEDLSHWMIMLLNEGRYKGEVVFPPTVIEALFSPNIVMPVSKRQRASGTLFRTYALGWGVSDFHGQRRVEHSGGMPGYLSLITLLPDDGWGIVTLINDMTPLTRVLHNLFLSQVIDRVPQIDLLKGLSMDLAEERKTGEKRKAERISSRKIGTQPRLGLEAYVGRYEDAVYGDAEVTLVDGKLRLTLLPTSSLFVSEMEHWHCDTFRIQFKDIMLPEGYVSFFLDANARVESMKIDLPNPDLHFHQLDFRKQEAPR